MEGSSGKKRMQREGFVESMASSSNVPFNGFGSLSAALSIDKEEHDRRILDEAALEIGTIIMKKVNGVTIMGIVIDFDLETNSYKAVNEGNQMEEIARRELRNYLAPPYLASDYLMELNESFNLARGQVSPADLARLEEAKAMMPPTPSSSPPTPPKKCSQPENNEPQLPKNLELREQALILRPTSHWPSERPRRTPTTGSSSRPGFQASSL